MRAKIKLRSYLKNCVNFSKDNSNSNRILVRDNWPSKYISYIDNTAALLWHNYIDKSYPNNEANAVSN